MQLKSAFVVLALAGAVSLAGGHWTPSHAMGPVGPAAVNKTDASAVEQVHRKWRKKRYHRRHVHVPRYYRHRYRAYDYAYDPYYDAPYYGSYYRPYYRPYYGAYFGPRYYGGFGYYGPRFGIRLGW